MNVCVALLLGLTTWAGVRVSGEKTFPVVVTDSGRDIHYFTTSGWWGLQEGVVVARGMPLVLTCDFRNKVRRVAGPDGVMRSEVVTNITSVNITFPSGAGQEVRQISPLVNKFKGVWNTYSPEATVFFPAVTTNTEVQCSAAYLEAGKNLVSVIQISVTPSDGIPVWKRSVDMNDVSRVECKAYDLLVSRVDNYSRMDDVVSLMMADDQVLTTVPRTAVLLPFTGEALFPSGSPNETSVHLFADDKKVKDQIICVVYHVHRPDWGAYVTSIIYERKSFSWLLATVFSILILAMVVTFFVLLLLKNQTGHVHRYVGFGNNIL